jgi:hypothetical protein
VGRGLLDAALARAPVEYGGLIRHETETSQRQPAGRSSITYAFSPGIT